MTFRHVSRLILAGAIIVPLTACSVGMAARTGGIKIEDVTQCQTRQCLLSLDTAEVIDSTPQPGGGKLETYRYQLKRGSAGRAAMHGLLDVATIGMWEVVGTPMEATKKRKYVVIKATYDATGKLVSAAFVGSPTKVDPAKAAG